MPTAQEILAYFGTFTAGTDGAANAFQFEYLTTLGFAAIVIFLAVNTFYQVFTFIFISFFKKQYFFFLYF